MDLKWRRHYRVLMLTLLILFGLEVVVFSLVIPIGNLREDLGLYLLLFILTWITFWPLIYRFVRRSLHVFDPSIWFALYYFLLFGARTFYILRFGSPILGLHAFPRETSSIEGALVVAVIGLGMFWVGYYLPFGSIISRSLPRLPGQWRELPSAVIGFLCLVMGWGIRVIYIVSQFGSLSAWLATNKYDILAQAEGTTFLSVLSALAPVGSFVFLILARAKMKWFYFTIFIVSCVFELFFRFLSGSRIQAIFFLLSILVVLYMTSDRSFKATLRYSYVLVSLVILAALLYPLLSLLRGGLGEGFSLSLLINRAMNFWVNPSALLEVIMIRQHGIDSLVLIMQHVPLSEPYGFDWQFSSLLWAWIPRRFWSEKPVVSLGKILYERMFPQIFHRGTSVSVTLPGSFYWCCGYVGILIGMLSIGILWRALWSYLAKYPSFSATLVTATVFPAFFIIVEQDFVTMLTSHLATFLLTLGVGIMLGSWKNV